VAEHPTAAKQNFLMCSCSVDFSFDLSLTQIVIWVDQVQMIGRSCIFLTISVWCDIFTYKLKVSLLHSMSVSQCTPVSKKRVPVTLLAESPVWIFLLETWCDSIPHFICGP
jgi:hypothetical protein